MSPPQFAGQWCRAHGLHMDDPDHTYQRPTCDLSVRWATDREEARVIIKRWWRRLRG